MYKPEFSRIESNQNILSIMSRETEKENLQQEKIIMFIQKNWLDSNQAPVRRVDNNQAPSIVANW